MNQRNVEALTALVIEVAGQRPSLYPRALAELLAARGVLVPSALTDEEISFHLWDEGVQYVAGEEHQDHARANPSGMRSALERIAKGEA